MAFGILAECSARGAAGTVETRLAVGVMRLCATFGCQTSFKGIAFSPKGMVFLHVRCLSLLQFLGDWRHGDTVYIGLEDPVVPSEVRYDWIPRESTIRPSSLLKKEIPRARPLPALLANPPGKPIPKTMLAKSLAITS